MKTPCLLLFLWWAIGGMTFAQAQPAPGQGKVTSVPKGAAVNLKLSERALIGDLLIGEFIITNSGSELFSVETGGDYRGSPVHQRLRVVVTDASGNVLPDISKGGFSMGGFSGWDKIEPGGSKAIRCPLHGYAALVEPGGYTISAWHDLGWRLPKDVSAPVASAKIELTLPSAKEAEMLVKRLCEKADSESRWQLHILQNPIFTASLLAEAKFGRAHACVGLGNIPSEAANKALLDLIQSETREVAIAAAAALTTRLPSLQDSARPAIASFSDRNPREAILKAWRPDFDKPLLDGARKLLEDREGHPVPSSRNFSGSGMMRPQDGDAVSLGAQLIEARGGESEARALLSATQRALNVYARPRNGPGVNTLDAPAPLHALIRAIDALRQRGWRTNGLGGTAVILAYYRQLADLTIPRPEGDRWKQSVHAFIDANPPVFRENALRAIPVPITDEWEKPLMKALEDADWGVVRTACEIAGKSGRKVFIRPLVQVIENIHESFVQGSAHEAALKLGAGFELWEAWCEVIPDKERVCVALDRLITGTIALPRGGTMSGTANFPRDQSFRIRQTWREFLAKHQTLLSAGNRVPEDDPSVVSIVESMDLGANGFVVSLGLKDGTYSSSRSS